MVVWDIVGVVWEWGEWFYVVVLVVVVSMV